MSYETLKQVLAVVVPICAIGGFLLSVVNLWRQHVSDLARVTLECVADRQPLFSEKESFIFNVINLSRFPVAVKELGILVQEAGTVRRHSMSSWLLDHAHMVVEPRRSQQFQGVIMPQMNADLAHRTVGIYCKTACGLEFRDRRQPAKAVLLRALDSMARLNHPLPLDRSVSPET